MSTDNTAPPAAGERRAIGGYQGQYRFAAGTILPRLRDGTLLWIKVADPEAGRLDDLQVCTAGRVDAYQVKWSRFAGTFSFRDLVAPTGDAPSLIAQLADGWKRLSTAHPGSRVVVHLVTNDIASRNDSPPGATSPAMHFAGFFAACWPTVDRPSHLTVPVPAIWQVAWNQLAAATPLDAAEFSRFVADCRLDFGTKRPDEEGAPGAATAMAGECAVRAADLDSLNLALYKVVADPRQVVHLSREQLLDVLRWRSRTEFRSRHEFPEPTIPYHAVQETVDELEHALGQHAGGYLLVVGTPGSGKSTLLTRTTRYRPERVIRYYAYTPDALEPNNQRGESVNFLHDLSLSMEHMGFSVGDTLPTDNVHMLRPRVQAQLQQLGRDFQATGRKTIIVVDGLDHVAREQSPERSFLKDLPLPSHLPAGVLVVLGSQSDQLPDIPSAVRALLQEPSRRISMGRLPRSAVVSIASSSVEGLAESDIYRIVELSGGHPLALAYIINGLRQRSGDPPSAVLDAIEPFRQRIDEQYEAQLFAVEADHGVVHLLALLARVRAAIDMSWVERWAEREVLFRLRRFDFYFRREADGRWYFFHNSFRAFLRERTRMLPGIGSTEGDARLYRELAEHCAVEARSSPRQWDELYYRSHAGDDHRVLPLAVSDTLRDQFYAGRDLEAIQADVRLALRAAGSCNDVAAFVRLVFAGAEFQLRAYHLREVPTIELLLAQGKKTLAADHAREGHRLRISAGDALKASAAFALAGMDDEARRLFDLAEPLEVLNKPSVPATNEVEAADKLLVAWADAAPRFRSAEQILELIAQLRREEGRFHAQSAEEATHELQAQLRFKTAVLYAALGRWTEAETVVARFSSGDATDWPWWFWWHAHAWRYAWNDGDRERARALVATAQAATEQRTLDIGEQISLAEGLYRVSGDIAAARKIARALPQPSQVGSSETYSSRGFWPFDHLFRLNRILGALGDTRSPSTLIPDSQKQEDEHLVFFERLVIHVARLAGQGWSGGGMPGASFAREAFPVLRFFNQRPAGARDSFYRALAARDELLERLIDAAALHGAEAVEALRAAFDAEWTAAERKQFWPASAIRAAAMAFFHAGAQREWCFSTIERLDHQNLEELDPNDRLEDAAGQVRAYVALGASDKANRAYSSLLAKSCAVGHKDDQLVSWITWAERASFEDPVGGPERFGRLASYLPAVRESDEVLSYTGEELLRAVCRWNAAAGVALTSWYFAHGILSFTSGLETLLEELARYAELTDLVFGMYYNLLLPLERGPSKALVTALVEAVVKQAHPGEMVADAERKLRRLWQTMSVSAMPSARAGLYWIVKNGADTLGLAEFPALSPEDAAVAKRESTSSVPDESKAADAFGAPELTMQEVRALASSVDGVVALLDRERPRAWFNWLPTLRELVSRASAEDIDRLRAAFHGKPREDGRASEINLLFSQRLRELGATQGTWELAELAFHEAPTYGWRRRYDGGSRVKALEALHRLDEGRAQIVGYRSLVDGLTNQTLDCGSIAGELHRILPLITGDVSNIAVWEHINKYLPVLFSYAHPVTPPMLPVPGAIASRLEIARFAVEFVGHPTYFVEHGAQRLIVDALVEGDDAVLEAVREKLADPEAPHDALLSVLECVQGKSPECVMPLHDVLIGLLRSPHQGIRWSAQRIIGAAPQGSDGNVRVHGLVPMGLGSQDSPAIYGLSLPPPPPSSRLGLLPDGVPLPVTNNVSEIVGVFLPELSVIADAAGVQLAALCTRVLQIISAVDPTSLTDKEVELMRQLRSIDLELTFRRPRSRAVRMAMYHALAELVDAGRVSPTRKELIEEALRNADPATLLLRPERRPRFVGRLPPSESGDYDYDRWARAATTDTSALFAPASDVNGLVLAEETTIKSLAWQVPTELRQGVRVLGWPEEGITRWANDLLSELCEQWRHVPISEYFTHDCESDSLVIVQSGERFETPCRRWLAINPDVARDLGWTPSPDGLFRWVDEHRSVMVESIWWEDGFLGQRPPQFHDQVGEGWLVLLSEQGARTVEGEFGKLTVCARVERKAKDQKPTRAVRQDIPE